MEEGGVEVAGYEVGVVVNEDGEGVGFGAPNVGEGDVRSSWRSGGMEGGCLETELEREVWVG